MPSPDLLANQLGTPQSASMIPPATVASATTIAPTGFISLVSGTAAIVNVTPPIAGAHMLVLIPTGLFTMTAAGNLITALPAAVVGIPILLFYNPTTGKYANGKLVIAAS